MTDYRVRRRCHAVIEGGERCRRIARISREEVFLCRQHHQVHERRAENPKLKIRIFESVEYLV